MAGSRAAASASHGTMASASTSPSIEDKCCECAPLAADAGEDSEDDLDEVLNRIMVPAESSAPTFEDTLAASENLFEKTCEILGIPKTETQILAEDDTGMLIPRPAAPRCLDRTMERIAEQDIAAVDTRLPKEQLSDFLETSGGGIGSGFHA